MYMTLSIIDMDFLYQFNLRLIAPLFTASFHEMFEKKKVFQDFQMLAGLWLVGEMDNHVGIYGSKVAEGFSAFQRRSCCSLFWFYTLWFCQCWVQTLGSHKTYVKQKNAGKITSREFTVTWRYNRNTTKHTVYALMVVKEAHYFQMFQTQGI